MTGSRKTPNTATKTVTIAMYAVAQHMIDRDLPAPTSIEAPQPLIGERAVIVRVYPEHADAWLDSLIVDDERVSTANLDTLYQWQHVVYDAHIDSPIGRVALQIRTLRKVVPLRLLDSAVSA